MKLKKGFGNRLLVVLEVSKVFCRLIQLLYHHFFDNDENTFGNDDLVRGYSLYLDVESIRQNLELRYGLSESVEISMEISLLSFGGGSMDSTIEGVHDTFGVPNSDQRGAYRAYSDKNQYAFYVVKDGLFLVESQEKFDSKLYTKVGIDDLNLALEKADILKEVKGK